MSMKPKPPTNDNVNSSSQQHFANVNTNPGKNGHNGFKPLSSNSHSPMSGLTPGNACPPTVSSNASLVKSQLASYNTNSSVNGSNFQQPAGGASGSVHAQYSSSLMPPYGVKKRKTVGPYDEMPHLNRK